MVSWQCWARRPSLQMFGQQVKRHTEFQLMLLTRHPFILCLTRAPCSEDAGQVCSGSCLVAEQHGGPAAERRQCGGGGEVARRRVVLQWRGSVTSVTMSPHRLLPPPPPPHPPRQSCTVAKPPPAPISDPFADATVPSSKRSVPTGKHQQLLLPTQNCY